MSMGNRKDSDLTTLHLAIAQNKPHTSRAQNKPFTSSAQNKPYASSVQNKPQKSSAVGKSGIKHHPLCRLQLS